MLNIKEKRIIICSIVRNAEKGLIRNIPEIKRLAKYLEASKYAILNYSGEYSNRSSGVVFDTLFNGVPVIGKKCQYLSKNDVLA